MFMKIGQIAYAPEGEGSGGGAPEGGEGGSAHPVMAPWADVEGVWTVGEGDAARPWYEAIPEPEARAHVEAKKYANPAELALANYRLTKMQRGADDVLTFPGKDGSEDDWNAFFTKTGRPDSAEAYELKFGEGADDKMAGFGKDLFFEMGLDNARAQKAADKWNGFVAEQAKASVEAAQKENTEALAALETKWGADLEKNKAAGQRVLNALGLSEGIMDKVEGSIGSAPLVELMVAIGRKSDEGGFTSGSQQMDPNNPDTMTKEQATSRIKQLQGDTDFQKQYTDANHPGHKDALRMMERLFSKA